MNNHFNCIYMYTNKINGKRYIGLTKDFYRRHKEHIRYNTQLIDKAIDKYGIENFDVVILKENLTSEEMNYWECYYINFYNTLANDGQGYNLADGGYGNPYEGKTEEEIKEIGRKISETKLKNGDSKGNKNPMYGKHHTEETKRKISEAGTGRIVSDETKQKISDTLKGDGCYWYGKTLTNEHKQKLRKAKLNKPLAEEHKKHISESGKGKRVGINNHQATKVAQYDKEGNLIKVWDYIKQASDELGINRVAIGNCCRGKSKTSGGFVWKYID